MRAANELGIRSCGIFSFEDRLTAHRYKADESFMVGQGLSPVAAYLNTEEIVDLMLRQGVDAVHPGYGFLSENEAFARACEAEGITFVGPTSRNLHEFGDKTIAREMAIAAGVPVVPGTDGPVSTYEQAKAFTDEFGFPIIIKAAMGGGGRGMRVVETADELEDNFARASSEALAAFGDGTVFLERYVRDPRHVEVQTLGDGAGNVVHLLDRDCSVQRRHQKVVETAPADTVPQGVRDAMFADAVRLTAGADYRNAGTVEFLVDPATDAHYFIEVNPRIQVEHTVTEEVTGIDLVQSQIRIAAGESFADIGLDQGTILAGASGHAIQCRVTTENPARDFSPDSGVLSVYREPGGMGIRLDGGPGFEGAGITPHYDSLLTKVTARGATREKAAAKLRRALVEFRIRGVNTNVPFLAKVLEHPDFLAANERLHTGFIGDNPQLLAPEGVGATRNRASKLLRFLGDTIVNGTPKELGADVARFPPSKVDPVVPPLDAFKNYDMVRHSFTEPGGPGVPPPLRGAKSLRATYVDDGPRAFAKAVRAHEGLLVTDTTWRDAHQSLLATRVRTCDLEAIALPTAAALRNAYSLEMWGGATFDVAMRFLRECPWDRLARLRELVPDIPFQMLLRGANAVGYTSYPDNVVFKFCDVATRHGMDVFRIFDSLNYIENMRLGIDAVGAAGGIVEAAVCYTGDVSDPTRTKYNLDYYMDFVQQLVDLDIHVLAIKDMAGLLKPQAATQLVGALRAEWPDLPIHVHTHDTSGTGTAAMLACAEAGADAVDLAIDAMSGTTSQPSLGAVVGALRNHPSLDTGLDPSEINLLNEYWEQSREVYAPFESGQKSGSADVYRHEMPGGQYTNLLFQSTQLGLAGQWPAIKTAYAAANQLLGDIIKVTPSSKVVGDLAQFMVQNNLSEQDVRDQASTLSFPLSVVEFFQGYLGIPHGGFPEPLRSQVLEGKPLLPNGKSCFDGRPGAEMAAFDFAAAEQTLRDTYATASGDDGAEGAADAVEIRDELDVLSYAMYPAVFDEWMAHRREYGDAVAAVPTRNFLAGLEVGEEVSVTIEHGKTLFVRLESIGAANDAGERDVVFELNGSRRQVKVKDNSLEAADGAGARPKAVEGDPGSVGAPMPGVVVDVKVARGDSVDAGDPLVILSAMKMETVVAAPVGGSVADVACAAGDNMDGGDLLVAIESSFGEDEEEELE